MERIERKTSAQRTDGLSCTARWRLPRSERAGGVSHDCCNDEAFAFCHTASGHGRNAKTQAACVSEVFVARHRHRVAADLQRIQRLDQRGSLQPQRPQISDDERNICAPGELSDTACRQGGAKRTCVAQHLGAVFAIRGLQRLAECDCLCRNDVHERRALQAGAQGRIQLCGQRRIIAQDQAAARASQVLVSGGGDHIGMRQGIGEVATGNQPGHMRHVHQQSRADLTCDGCEALKSMLRG